MRFRWSRRELPFAYIKLKRMHGQLLGMELLLLIIKPYIFTH